MKYHLNGIEVLSFSTGIEDPNRINSDNMSITFQASALPADDNENLVFSLMVKYRLNDVPSEAPPLMNIEVGFRYYFDDALSLFDPEDCSKLKLDDQVLTTYLTMSYSTIRGILHERLRGSQLHYAWLPVVNPEYLLAEFKGTMNSMKDALKVAITEMIARRANSPSQ